MKAHKVIVAKVDGVEFDAVEIDGQLVGIESPRFEDKKGRPVDPPDGIPFIHASYKGYGNIAMHLVCSIGGYRGTSFTLARRNCTTSEVSKNRVRRELEEKTEKWLPFAARVARVYWKKLNEQLNRHRGISREDAHYNLPGNGWSHMAKQDTSKMPLSDAQLEAAALQDAKMRLIQEADQRETERYQREAVEEARRAADPCPDLAGEAREVWIEMLREIVSRYQAAGEKRGTVAIAREVVEERGRFRGCGVELGRKAVEVEDGRITLPEAA